MTAASGMTYAPKAKPTPACRPGELRFSAVGLDHGHIYGMCNGLVEAGAELVSVYDPDPEKVAEFLTRFPGTRVARSADELLEDPSVQLVACASVPAERAELGIAVMEHGKDFFVDKPPLTTLGQLRAAREATGRTRRKYAVYYSERIHVEAAVLAGELIARGAIGRVFHVLGMGPHRADAPNRPKWFWDPERAGGILVDIGSHQAEQFLFYTGASDASVSSARIANYSHKEHPSFEDFGDCSLVGDNGATGYFRVDWFTPKGLSAWGDGRTFLLGTDGYIELRKYVDIAREPTGQHVYLVNDEGEHHFSVAGQVGYPFFTQFVRDCLERTEEAMPQGHAFKAIEICLNGQSQAMRVA